MIVTVWHTGCSIMIDQKFELHTQATIQPRSWKRCSFSFDVWIFWNCAFDSSKKFHIVLKYWWNFDAQIFRICKKHRKSRSKQMSVLLCQYHHNESSDFHEILCGGQLLSSELKFQISWKSSWNLKLSPEFEKYIKFLGTFKETISKCPKWNAYFIQRIGLAKIHPCQWCLDPDSEFLVEQTSLYGCANQFSCQTQL